MNKNNYFLFILFHFLFFMSGANFFTNCKADDADSRFKHRQQIPPHEQKLKDYYSENHRGKWADLDQEHSPIVKMEKTKKSITITASSPFTSQPDHYTEMILFTDYALKEIDKKTFSRTVSGQAQAVFTLPPEFKGEFYIMLKCNLHDMWFKKIIIP